MTDTSDARNWLVSNLENPDDDEDGYYASVAEYVRTLPDADSSIVALVSLWSTYSDKPRNNPLGVPSVGLNGPEDDDLADVLHEIILNDTIGGGVGGDGGDYTLYGFSHNDPPAAFLVRILATAFSWLVGEIDSGHAC